MPVIVNIFLGVFIGIGLLTAGFGVRTVLRDHAAADWPVVPGQITESTIVTDSSGDGVTYKPAVTYRYTVNGQEFTGKRISFGADRISSSGRFAGRYTAKYPAGAPVRVAYRPDEPSMCALETGIDRRSFVTVAFGLGFALFGAWFRLLMWLMDS